MYVQSLTQAHAVFYFDIVEIEYIYLGFGIVNWTTKKTISRRHLGVWEMLLSLFSDIL